MKKTILTIMIVFCMFCMCPVSVGATVNTTSENVSNHITNDENGIPDKGLYQAILNELNKNEKETFTQKEAESITSLEWYEGYSTKFMDIKSLKGIGYLKNLESLDISSDELTTLDGIEELKKLWSIQVYGDNLTEFNALESCTSLGWLTISSDKLSSLETLGKMSNLQSLNVSGNKLKSLQGIQQFSNLEYLDVTSNKLKNLKGIESLKKLKDLSASYNNLKNVKEVKGLKNLERLFVNHNKLTDIDEVKGLTKLKVLDASYNQLKKIPNLTKLKKLKFDGYSSGLDLTHNKLSEKEIRKKLPKKLLNGGGKAKKAWLKDLSSLQNLNYKLKMIAPKSLNKITSTTTKIKGKTLPNACVYLDIVERDSVLGWVKADKNGYFEMKGLNLEEYAGKKAEIWIEIESPGTKKEIEIEKEYSFVIKRNKIVHN